MKTISLLTLLVVSGLAFAVEESPVGRTSIRIEEVQPGRSIREIRKEMAAIDKEIATLEQQTKDTQIAATASRISSGSTQTYGLESAKSALELKKSQALAKRAQLVEDLEKLNQ